MPVIHIPSRDSRDESTEEVDNISDLESPPVKKSRSKDGVFKKRGKNRNEQDNSVLRLTRGRKRKLEAEGGDGFEDIAEDRDEDCVIVERNYPEIPTNRGKHLQSETIVIDD